MSMLKEFREFAVKGNVVDMAIGIIIGGAFGKIVSSLVADVIMPPIGVILGGMDFSKFSIELVGATDKVAAVTLKYGVFIQATLDFTIVAFAMFLLVKLMNRLKRHEAQAPTAPAKPPAQEVLLTEIRDLLKAGR